MRYSQDASIIQDQRSLITNVVNVYYVCMIGFQFAIQAGTSIKCIMKGLMTNIVNNLLDFNLVGQLAYYRQNRKETGRTAVLTTWPQSSYCL